MSNTHQNSSVVATHPFMQSTKKIVSFGVQLTAIGFLGLINSADAFAKDAVVVPLYSPNMDAGKIGNITSLLTSEVDFSGRYDMVSQANSRPSTLNPQCLQNVPCLKKIADNEGVNAMVTGSVTKKGNNLEFFLVLYEDVKIIRMKRFTVEDSPLSLAADVGGYVQEVVTGVAPKKANNMSTTTEDIVEEEDFAFESDVLDGFSLDGDDTANQKAKEQAAREQAAKEQAAREQAERLAQEEADRKAKEASQAPKEEFSFSFSSSYSIIEEDTSSNSASSSSGSSSSMTDEGSLDLNFSSSAPSNKSSSTSSSSKNTTSSSKTASSSKSTSSSTATKKKSPSKSSRLNASATLTGKVGGGNFQSLNFITYGGEVGVHVSEAVSINIGGEGYATNQKMPVYDEDGEDTGLVSNSWRVIIPLSLGVQIHFPGTIAKPYVGVDVQGIPGYAGPGSGFAMGAKLRGGSNFMITDAFGFNLNVSAAYWSGKYFTLIPDTMGGTLSNSGIVPQVSLGTVVTF